MTKVISYGIHGHVVAQVHLLSHLLIILGSLNCLQGMWFQIRLLSWEIRLLSWEQSGHDSQCLLP